MSQCVPSWDLDDNSALPSLDLRAHSNSNSLPPHVPMLDYEVAELTWENGQLSLHGLGPPRVVTKQTPTWEKPRAGGTLESIVNQATTGLPHSISTTCNGSNSAAGEDLVSWFNHHRHIVGATPSTTVSMDAIVPCDNGIAQDQPSSQVPDRVQTCAVGSCSGNNAVNNNRCSNRDDLGPKRARAPCVPVAPSQPEWSSMDNSFSASATFGRDNRQLTLDTCERELGVCASASMGSPENTSSGQEGTKAEEHDSVSHRKCKREKGNEGGKKKRGEKSSVTTRRSRAAATHNQSERKRRDKINQRMKTLQKLVPNSSKTDKASMLDEVIEYVKQLQAQVNMINRMNMPSMMLPLTLQQQLQLSMMAATAPMSMGGMGMGMGMGISMGMGFGGITDLNSIGRHNPGGISPMLHPAAFMPLASWDNSSDRLSNPTAVAPDPMSAFHACQSQPMTMDAYSRMAALYQQLNQFPPPASKKLSE